MLGLLKIIFLPLPIEPHSSHFIGGHEGLMWFIIYSNVLIVISYALIPMCALFIVRKRKDLVFNWVVLLIGLFISLCGVTHLLHIIIFFYSLYWLQAIFELLTAAASFAAFFALIYVTPKIVKLTSPQQLEGIARKLEQEIITHELVEKDLHEKNLNIEKSNQIIELKNEEMLRLNQFMQGRENKISELKTELEVLKGKTI